MLLHSGPVNNASGNCQAKHLKDSEQRRLNSLLLQLHFRRIASPRNSRSAEGTACCSAESPALISTGSDLDIPVHMQRERERERGVGPTVPDECAQTMCCRRHAFVLLLCGKLRSCARPLRMHHATSDVTSHSCSSWRIVASWNRPD